MSTIEGLQPAGSVHALNSNFDELSVFNPRRPPSTFDQTKPAQNFQMRGEPNFQMRWKLRLE
jgi:hypothetical protein